MARPVRWWVVVGFCLATCVACGVIAAATDLFVDSGQRLGNEASWSVALGDVDGDGDLDAVVANFDAGAIIWLNDGAGQFTDSGQRLGTGLYESVELADFDGDGAPDVLLGSWDLPIAIWWNDGTGAFVRGSLPSVYGSCQSLAFGDVNADSRLDILIGTDVADRLLLNAGDRRFTDSGQRFGGAPTGGVAFGDMDGDSDLDVVAAGWDEAGHVWVNDGTGQLTSLCTLDVATLHVHAVALADYEGDGDLDAFFALASHACCRDVWLNDGAGRLTSAPFDLGDQNRNAIAAADLDLDGDVDIVQGMSVSIDSVPSRVWLGQDGGFVDSGVRIGNALAGRIAVGDLDGDGDLDLFAAFFALPEMGWDYKPYPNEVWINTTNE